MKSQHLDSYYKENIMKFNCVVVINKNIKDVSTAFEDPKAMEACQKDFVEIIQLTGKKGATAKLVYKKFNLIETILENNLPNIFYAKYDHKHTSNIMSVRFKAISPSVTEYHAEIEYLVFRGFIVKLMSKIAPGFFKKQVMKWMKRFKVYVEKNY